MQRSGKLAHIPYLGFLRFLELGEHFHLGTPFAFSENSPEIRVLDYTEMTSNRVQHAFFVIVFWPRVDLSPRA